MAALTEENRILTLFSLTQVPLIKICGAKIVEHTSERTVSFVPLRFLTRNHLKSMYFGALMIGAEVAAGFHLFSSLRHEKAKLSFAFKSTQANFLRRADGDVRFECNHHDLDKFIDRVRNASERLEHTVTVEAYVFDKNQQKTKVVDYQFTISALLKRG